MHLGSSHKIWHSRILEGVWDVAQPIHMCFVDLEKAFVSVGAWFPLPIKSQTHFRSELDSTKFALRQPSKLGMIVQFFCIESMLYILLFLIHHFYHYPTPTPPWCPRCSAHYVREERQYWMYSYSCMSWFGYVYEFDQFIITRLQASQEKIIRMLLGFSCCVYVWVCLLNRFHCRVWQAGAATCVPHLSS